MFHTRPSGAQVTDVVSSSRMWALADPVFLDKSPEDLERILAELRQVLRWDQQDFERPWCLSSKPQPLWSRV